MSRLSRIDVSRKKRILYLCMLVWKQCCDTCFRTHSASISVTVNLDLNLDLIINITVTPPLFCEPLSSICHAMLYHAMLILVLRIVVS